MRGPGIVWGPLQHFRIHFFEKYRTRLVFTAGRSAGFRPRVNPSRVLKAKFSQTFRGDRRERAAIYDDCHSIYQSALCRARNGPFFHLFVRSGFICPAFGAHIITQRETNALAGATIELSPRNLPRRLVYTSVFITKAKRSPLYIYI